MKKIAQQMIVAWGFGGVLLVVGSPGVVVAGGDENEVEKKVVCTTVYGGGTECRTEEYPKEEVVHDVQEVDTGMVENLMVAGGVFGLGFVGLMALQKKVGGDYRLN